MARAREAVIEDSEILGGTAVFKGTRVPVYDVAAMVEAGVSMEEILETYPSLKSWQVELAPIYAQAIPSTGRPKRSVFHLPSKGVIVKKAVASSLTFRTIKTR